MRLVAINSMFRMTSLWVDSAGRLLVATDDTPKPLPIGAQLAREVLVDDTGRVVVSPL